ncbi:CDT1-like protein a [Hirschfeldia incana]|nr:CDT1-like protein a [Hirschfeldia incana]
MSAPGGSSGSIPFKSKKRLLDSPCSKSQTGNPNQPSVPFPTPEKPPEAMHTRSKNRSVALSVKEIRQAAGSRRRSEDPAGKASSARGQLLFSSNDSSSSSASKRKNTDKDKLPEKYEILGKFFDALDSTIVLSRLRGSKPIFSNISGKIEHLTERRFCYSHLAQIKHILPEAVEIKRVLIHDEATSCMKPDLHVTLNADAVVENVNSNSESKKKISLRKVFRTRLADFVKSHPQGDEVPEEQLPELFNRKKPNEDSKAEEVKSASTLMGDMASIPAAKLISSFMKAPSTPVNAASSPAKPTASSALSKISLAPTPVKSVSTPARVPSTPAKIDSTPVKSLSVATDILSTPAKIDPTPVIVASTPPEFASTPARLFSTSLASRLQKRSCGDASPDDVSADPPAKLARRSSLSSSRSLNFDSYAEDADEDADQVAEEDASSDDEILSILPDKLRQSIKEQERKAIEESNPAISEAKRRRKMIACLPKLFNVIHYLIQSIRRWVITKEELVHKIIAGHSDITDRKEIEEQLILMQELVPEWISEKRSSSGDLLVCINKLASPQTIRSHLEEENKKAAAPTYP